MPAAITIKQLTEADAALLSSVALKAYDDHYLHLWYDNGEWYRKKSFSKEILASELTDTNNLFYLAYTENEPVGFLKLRIDAPIEITPKKNALELERIYLTKAASGKGIGRQLVEMSVAIAKKHHKEIIWLKAMDTSNGPIAFYIQMGFELCGTCHLTFEQMKEELRGMVIMKKAL